MSLLKPVSSSRLDRARANLIIFMWNDDEILHSMGMDIAFPIPFHKVFNLCSDMYGNISILEAKGNTVSRPKLDGPTQEAVQGSLNRDVPNDK